MTSIAVRRSDRPEPASDAGGRSRWWPRFWPPVASVGVAITLWWAATSALCAPQSLLRQTAPQHVLAALGDLLGRGVLVPDTAVSLYRLVIGLLIAALVGIPAGLLIGLSRTAERAAGPLVAFLRMISPLSWTPITVAVFGIGSQPVIFLIAAAAVWPVLLGTVAGVHAIDPGYLHVAQSLHASRFEQLTAVVLPGVRVQVQNGLRLALGIAWVVLVPAEMLGVRSGLGYQILNARDQLDYASVVAVIAVIGVLGYLLDLAARLLLAPRRATAG